MKPLTDSKNDNLIKRNLNGIVLFVAILLSIFIIYSFASPAFTSYQETNQKIKDSNTQKDVLVRTIANLKAKNLASEEKRLEPVNKFFPSNVDVLQMLTSIELMAENSGLRISQLSAKNDQLEASGPYYIVSGTFEGSYESILSFLVSLKNSQRAIGVKSLTFNPQDGGGQSISISAELVYPVIADKQTTANKAVTIFIKDEEEIIRNLAFKNPAPQSTASASFGRQNPFSESVVSSPQKP